MLLHIYPMLRSGEKNTFCKHGMLNTFIVYAFNMKLQLTKQNKNVQRGCGDKHLPVLDPPLQYIPIFSPINHTLNNKQFDPSPNILENSGLMSKLRCTGYSFHWHVKWCFLFICTPCY